MAHGFYGRADPHARDLHRAPARHHAFGYRCREPSPHEFGHHGRQPAGDFAEKSRGSR
jgi:hypothetical protein